MNERSRLKKRRYFYLNVSHSHNHFNKFCEQYQVLLCAYMASCYLGEGVVSSKRKGDEQDDDKILDSDLGGNFCSESVAGRCPADARRGCGGSEYLRRW